MSNTKTNIKYENENKHWTQEEINYLKDHYLNYAYKDIAQHLGKTDGAIRAKLNDLKLVKKSFWTKEDIEFLMSNYENMTYKELGYYLQRSEDAVQIKAKKLGIKKTPYSCNHFFFSKIDTEEKAYWLGFLYADGYVTINPISNSTCVGIDLQRKDIRHLKSFNKSIAGNYKIVEYEKTVNNVSYKMCRIRVYSSQMGNDLIKKGCTERKSKAIQFPKLEDNLYSHFIRGYFDGDGCISKSSNKTNTVSMDFTSGSLSFLESLKTYLYTKSIYSYTYKEKERAVYRLYIRGIQNVDNFWNYLYKDASIYLPRKYSKKEELYQTCNIAQRLPRSSAMKS